MCIYTNAAFLAAADSKRFVLFNVKDGKFVGVIQIPNHLERNKGGDDTSLSNLPYNRELIKTFKQHKQGSDRANISGIICHHRT